VLLLVLLLLFEILLPMFSCVVLFGGRFEGRGYDSKEAADAESVETTGEGEDEFMLGGKIGVPGEEKDVFVLG
jgi:hypothetical protein